MHPFTDIRRYRLGVPRVGFEPQGSALERKEKRKIFDEALEKLGGAVIVDPLNNPQLDEMLNASFPRVVTMEKSGTGLGMSGYW